MRIMHNGLMHANEKLKMLEIVCSRFWFVMVCLSWSQSRGTSSGDVADEKFVLQ